MKRIIKNNIKVIFAFVFGVILSTTTIYAANFASGDVEHTKSNGTKTTVQAALNELYTIHNSGTAGTADILSGKTAFAGGSLLTGSMSNYGSSTGQSSTLANTSNKLYVKPSNNGYYSTNSSFNTNINYNPKGTGGTAATTGTSVSTSSTNVTLSGSNLILDVGTKLTIPSGYYSSSFNVSSGSGGGMLGDNQYVAVSGAGTPTYGTYTVGTNVTVTGSSVFEIINVQGYNSFTLSHSSTNGMGSGTIFGIKNGIVTSLGSGTVDVSNYDYVIHSSSAGYGTITVNFRINN